MWDYIFSWTLLWWVLLPIYVVACLGLIVVVLLQKGKGTGFAGAFGVGGGSEAVFGPRSSRSLPQKLTYTAAGLFMVLALVLSILSGKVGKGAAPELIDETPLAESANLDELFQEGAAPATDGAATPAPDATATTPVVVEESTEVPAPVEAPAETPVAAPVETPAAAPAETPAVAPEAAAQAPVEPAPAPAPAESATPETPAAQ